MKPFDIQTHLNSHSIAHFHFDWLNQSDILNGEGVGFAHFSDDIRQSVDAILTLESIDAESSWIHSFFTIEEAQAQVLFSTLLSYAASFFSRRHFFYAIPYLSKMNSVFESEGFVQTDDFLQLFLPLNGNFTKAQDTEQLSFTEIYLSDIENILETCEGSFPPLYQLSRKNLHNAICASDYSIGTWYHGKLAAYALAQRYETEAQITRLSVSASVQRQGIGSMLLNTVLCDLQKLGYTAATVNTPKSDIPAVSLYENFGFSASADPLILYQKRI